MDFDPKGGLGKWALGQLRRLLVVGRKTEGRERRAELSGKLMLLAELVGKSSLTQEETVAFSSLIAYWRKSPIGATLTATAALEQLATKIAKQMRRHEKGELREPLDHLEEIHGDEMDHAAGCTDPRCDGVPGNGYTET